MRRVLSVSILVLLLFLYPARAGEGSRMNTIAAIGDSITDAVGRNSVADTNQWLYQLLGRLGETSIALSAHTPPSTPTTPNNKLTGTRFTAYNLGVGGNTSAQVRSRFTTDALALSPDELIIAIGHNDLYYGTPPATVASNVEWMIQQAQTAGARVIVCAVPPWNLDTEAQEDALVALNGLYAGLCTTYGADLVDWYTPLLTDAVARDSTYTETDDIHPNVAGQALLAAAFDLSCFTGYAFDDVWLPAQVLVPTYAFDDVMLPNPATATYAFDNLMLPNGTVTILPVGPADWHERLATYMPWQRKRPTASTWRNR